MTNVIPFGRRYRFCNLWVREYSKPRTLAICFECMARCAVCGAQAERCQNPSEAELSTQRRNFTRFMRLHRLIGDELLWFADMDEVNQTANAIDEKQHEQR